MDKSLMDKRRFIIEDLEILAEETNYANSSVMGALELLEGKTPSNKGDYEEAIKRLDQRIRVIDSAIPQHLYDELVKLNLPTNQYSYVYYHNGTQGLVNVIAEYGVLLTNI